MKLRILFVKPVFEILALVFTSPTKEFYEKEVSEKTKVSVGACNKYMRQLHRAGLLLKEKRGRMNFYRLDRESLLVKQLKVVFVLDSHLVNEIKHEVKDERTELFLYGSFARGEGVEDSDFDILLVSDREKQGKIESTLRKIGEKYGEDVRIVSFTRDEWVAMRKKDPAFYERVERDKIRLV